MKKEKGERYHLQILYGAWSRKKFLLSEMTDRYILKDGIPVPEPDLMKWAEFFEKTENRIVKQDEIDGVKISTIFLGINHNFGEGIPILYETMVFGGDSHGDMERYATVEEALVGHGHFCKTYLQ